MKHHFILNLLAISLGSTLVAADPEKSKTGRDEAFASVPNFNYWDANAWEAGSGASFWRETATAVTPSATGPADDKKAEKSRKQKKAQAAGN